MDRRDNGSVEFTLPEINGLFLEAETCPDKCGQLYRFNLEPLRQTDPSSEESQKVRDSLVEVMGSEPLETENGSLVLDEAQTKALVDFARKRVEDMDSILASDSLSPSDRVVVDATRNIVLSHLMVANRLRQGRNIKTGQLIKTEGNDSIFGALLGTVTDLGFYSEVSPIYDE